MLTIRIMPNYANDHFFQMTIYRAPLVAKAAEEEALNLDEYKTLRQKL